MELDLLVQVEFQTCANFSGTKGAKLAARTSDILKQKASAIASSKKNPYKGDPNLIRKIMGSTGLPRNVASRIASNKPSPLALSAGKSLFASLDPEKALPKSAIRSGNARYSNRGFSLEGKKKSKSNVNPYASC